MTIVEKSVPLELLGLHEGDTLVGFRIVGEKIVFQVAASEADAPPKAPEKRLGDWGRKWAGSLRLEPGESRASLREAALRAKFGS